VVEAVLTPAAAGNFNATIEELGALGFDRADRKYLVWFDASAYCGIATFWGDDRPTADNLSNSHTGYARVDTACWGWAEAHELMHTLGAVQNSAPHSTYGVAPGAFAHCTDDWDVMCYPDAPGVTMTIVCPDRGLDSQFDCGNDDYFDTDPAPGSYLGSHWNTADSDWLERTIVDLVPPRLRLVEGAQVTGSSIPAIASFASTAPLAGLERVGLQRRRDDAAWAELTPGAGAASIPLVLAAGHVEQLRARAIDATGLPGPWTTGPRRAVRLMSDGSRTLQWPSSWVAVEDASALGGTLRRASKPGATVTLRTAATDLGIVGTTGPDHGRLEVWVDGTRQRTVDLYATTASGRRVVDVVTMAPGQTHTVRLRVGAGRNASSTGGKVEVDALVLLTP
jgi:hypothetical protein